ncbi:MAG TPA: D-glycero-beta-D-manno-heptose 1-phosphate adenylyltransferase [Dinghuibacter sp.]|jgi:D-beta-D-heptose 7-phosphate kinase/D-beta-D-heptose 1-phosphate adenosyltransferase|uniref:D-glycero-beta-D-manno-heptose 1-phosphate adenylyltransferase n=1 Tax=Dinghuibacter sp. TaxID=2024697 RepID=UPI002C699DE8|nr:D-glycero-beta-D-manno-heptose 1-phosphate adenylyltransferase [Dinghuibacter sp.]HTJ11986.1 D-glycero-beta-D-manno-heptose 1-phosphate adenylyltransferase [Dinghuibacter sp.]
MYSLETLLLTVARERFLSRKIVFTNGCFDILHRGHIDCLGKAATFGDFLVVGVNSDASTKRLKGPQRPINKEGDRLLLLAALEFVDAVILFDEDTPYELITAVKPDVLAKGGDYQIDTIVGAKEVLGWGGAVEVIPYEQGYSTTGIIEKINRL